MHGYAADAKDQTRAIITLSLFCGAVAGAGFLAFYFATDWAQSRLHLSALIVNVAAPPGLVALFQYAYRGLWDRWVWRWGPVHGYLGLSDLQGTWRGQVEPTNPAIGNRTVVLRIKQRWLGVSVHFVARVDGSDDKAESDSTMAAFVTFGETTDFRYEYGINPGGDVATHRGVAHLRFPTGSLRPTEIHGDYYTDKDGDPQHWGYLRNFRCLDRELLDDDEAFDRQ